MLLDPEYMLIVGVVGAIGAVIGTAAMELGRKAGPEITSRDLMPLSPFEGPPLPRFTQRPELAQKIFQEGG